MKTIAAMLAFISMHSSPIDLSKASKSEMFCLSKAIYHESRGEPIDGQIAVAHVILNRTKSERYPNSVCKVIYQKKQFSDIHDVRPDYESKEWAKAVEVAVYSTVGIVDDPTKGSMYYYNPKKVDKKKQSWIKRLIVVMKINNHTFLKDK